MWFEQKAPSLKTRIFRLPRRHFDVSPTFLWRSESRRQLLWLGAGSCSFLLMSEGRKKTHQNTEQLPFPVSLSGVKRLMLKCRHVEVVEIPFHQPKTSAQSGVVLRKVLLSRLPEVKGGNSTSSQFDLCCESLRVPRSSSAAICIPK